MGKIEVRNLGKRFGDVVAVDDLSFEVAAGTVTGFVGPNGAGKSTTLRIMLGLVHASSGEALIDGMPYRQLPRPMSVVGAVLETGAFHPGRTARDHLRVLATSSGASQRRVDEVLEEVGLGGARDRRVGGFSLGMRQRLGLAGALLTRPPVLVLDEPGNGLDPEGVHWLRETIVGHAASGGTVLVSSHQLAELALAADRLVVIGAGHLLAQGTVEDLVGSGAVRVRTPDPAALTAALSARGVGATVTGPGDVEVPGVTAEEVGTMVAGTGIVIFEMWVDRPRLEDVVLSLTEGGVAR